MKVIKSISFQYNPDGTFTELDRDEFDYDGPVAQCFGGGGKSKSSTTNTTDIDTTNVGIEGVEGVGIAAAGDVEFNQTVTDQGAVQGAFDFAQDFSEDAFNFANDSQRQAGEIAERSLENSQAALATVATGGQSDLSKIDSKTIGIAVAALAAFAVLPKLIRSK